MRLEEQLEQCRQQELQELLQQQHQRCQQLEELLERPSWSPRPQESLPPQGPEAGDEGLPVYGPPTPAWLRPGGPASIPAEPGRADGVVALACAMRTPADPQSEIKGTIYGIEGSLPGSFETGDHGWISALLGRMKPEPRAEVTPARWGPGGQWTTMGISPPSSTCSCATGGRLRLSKSSSGASRHARKRRWRTRAPVRSAFEPPPIHQSPTL